MKSLRKALSIICSFSPNELELSASDLACKVGLPKSTAYRIVSCLTEFGFLEKNPVAGTYTVGPELYSQGSLYLSNASILNAADPVMKVLNELTAEAISVGILDKSNMILIMKEESKYAFRLTTHIGSILPAYASAIGKALLSELSDSEIERLIPKETLQAVTPKTIATKAKLKRDLEEIRRTGVAIDREGGYEGVESVASVIRDIHGKAIAALSIPVPIFRMNEANRERLTTLVRMGASLVNYRLGYKDSHNPIHDVEEIRSWWDENKARLAD